jgi:hypothetical protein
VDALTREIQLSFKRLDGEVRGMDRVGGQEDAQVRLQVRAPPAAAACGRGYGWGWGWPRAASRLPVLRLRRPRVPRCPYEARLVGR